MANEWAAMAMVPRGATMRVLTTYAPPISMCCSPIGAPILNAVLIVSCLGLNARQVFSLLTPHSSLLDNNPSIFDLASRKYIISPAVISMASPVPTAAPMTPISST